MSKELKVGDRVRVIALPPYVKTAEPMPMLRPPNVIKLGEEGVAIDRYPGGYWGIHLESGNFLLDSQYLEVVTATEETEEEKDRV
ncbi:MAG: regulatory protein SipA [Hormoscilla sp.]